MHGIISFAAGFPLSARFDLEIDPALFVARLTAELDGSGMGTAALATIQCTGAEESISECMLLDIEEGSETEEGRIVVFNDFAAIRCIGEVFLIYFYHFPQGQT